MKTALKEGAKAPPFSGVDQNGKTVQLSDFKGRTLILYFYPKDDTPGCTVEACSFRDSQVTFEGRGVFIIGVSPDPVKSHEKFAEKYGLEFPLIADEDKKIVNDYGVWVKKVQYGRQYMAVERSTFIIDGNGVIQKIFRNISPGDHVPEIWDELQS